MASSWEVKLSVVIEPRCLVTMRSYARPEGDSQQLGRSWIPTCVPAAVAVIPRREGYLFASCRPSVVVMGTDAAYRRQSPGFVFRVADFSPPVPLLWRQRLARV